MQDSVLAILVAVCAARLTLIYFEIFVSLQLWGYYYDSYKNLSSFLNLGKMYHYRQFESEENKKEPPYLFCDLVHPLFETFFLPNHPVTILTEAFAAIPFMTTVQDR